MKRLILDENLWADIELMNALFAPIVKLLRLVDSDLPTMGKVRHTLDNEDIPVAREYPDLTICLLT